jgi:hypothetical protein
VDIVGDADIVHEFDGITSGIWTFIDWIYVPSDFIGTSYFILLSDYEDGAGQNNKWALQVHFDSTTQLVESEFDSLTLPLITDQWVELRVEIDLEIDWFECYYDGELLVEKEWTAGPNNGHDGYLVIDAVDLWANGATSVYHDDLSLEGEIGSNPDLDCDGALSWVNVSTGATLTDTIIVENIAGGLLDWEIVDEPSWGTWTFDPASGDDLAPGTPQTIDVTVIAPEDKNEEFKGTIKIENKEDPADFCFIDVSLSTPRSKPLNILQQLLNFLEQHPKLFPILRALLEL